MRLLFIAVVDLCETEQCLSGLVELGVHSSDCRWHEHYGTSKG